MKKTETKKVIRKMTKKERKKERNNVERIKGDRKGKKRKEQNAK